MSEQGTCNVCGIDLRCSFECILLSVFDVNNFELYCFCLPYNDGLWDGLMRHGREWGMGASRGSRGTVVRDVF